MPPAIKRRICKTYIKYDRVIIADKSTLRLSVFDIAPLLKRLTFVGVGVANGRPEDPAVALMLPVGFTKLAETLVAL